MLKQIIVADTMSNEMLVELSDGEQEASNGGISMGPLLGTPSSDTPSSTPAFPSISVGMYEPPNMSCPACSSGMNPHGIVNYPAPINGNNQGILNLGKN
jgi:hypothetical protein